jgi:alpha-glucosidase
LTEASSNPFSRDDQEEIKENDAGNRPAFSGRAVFSDESPAYRKPFEPKEGDETAIRLRTLKNNVDEVFLISGVYRLPMHVAETRGAFDFYETKVHVGYEIICYYFEIRVGEMICYYNKLGVTRELSDAFAFRISPGFSIPAWTEGAVMYQIYTDRFCNGNPSNNVLTNEYFYLGQDSEHVEDWNSVPSGMDVHRFYGGDLQGVCDRLDYLKDLGIDVIYFNPIFVSPSNHKYDTQDYDHIDPHLTTIVKDRGDLLAPGDTDNRHAGRYICRTTDPENLEASDRFFAQFTEEVHKRGMRVILDGVFNHCGSFNKWLDRERIYENEPGYPKGAYIDADSPYRTFFKFNNEHAWPYNEFYDGWWQHDTLPKLNYESSPQLVEYILHVGVKWVSPPYNADGWRLDVAADLGCSQEYNHHFWHEFRKAVKDANPDAVILAEHYGDASEWLRGDQWDTVMNYDAFMEPVSWFLTGMEKHSDQFREDLLGNGEAFISAMRFHMPEFMGNSLLCSMNQLDNHDHSRFLTRTNHKVGRVTQLGPEEAGRDIRVSVLRSAVVIQMTWPGAPTLYYGDEAGVVGFTDPDNRRTYPWGNENEDLIDFYRCAIRVHHSHPALLTGSCKELGGGYHYISYGRFTDEEQIVVAVNSGEDPTAVEIPCWEIGVPKDTDTDMISLLKTDADGCRTAADRYRVQKGILTLDMAPFEAMILYRSTSNP